MTNRTGRDEMGIEQGGGASRRAHLLVVDDNSVVASTLGSLLIRAGFEVTVAHDGEQALSQAACRPPDLVLTDVNLPGIGGPALVRTMRWANPQLVGLLMSGSPCAPWEILSCGAKGCLLKPFDFADLMWAIEKALPEPSTSERRASHVRVVHENEGEVAPAGDAAGPRCETA